MKIKNRLNKNTLNSIDVLLRYLRKNSAYFNRLYKKNPQKIISVDDFIKLPLINKVDLSKVPLEDRLCCKFKNIREVHYSSGTTANPMVAAYTESDLKKSREYLSTTWKMQGAEKAGTKFAMLASYGLFSAGLINHYAIQFAGGTVIPISSASMEKVVNVLKQFKPEVGVAVSSYYLFFLDKLKSMNVDPKKIGFKKLIAGGEFMTAKQRSYIEKEFGAKVYFQYGLAEIDTGIAGECCCQNGMHLLDNYVYAEIINPETGEVLAPGCEGELVLSHLHREATPLLRYRTGDITSILTGKCPCGRTSIRIAPIKRRATNSISYKGINIDQDEFQNIIFKMKNGKFFNLYIWQLRLVTDGAKQRIELKVKFNKKYNKSKESELISNIKFELKSLTGINFSVFLFSDSEFLKISENKFKRLDIIKL